VAGALLSAALLRPAATRAQETNPYPVARRLPLERPQSAMAQLGERLFHDARLSGSGRMSCASCHSPERAYGPPGDGAVIPGGPGLGTVGDRAVPSLRYLYRQPPFTIGPDTENGTEPTRSLQQQARQSAGRALAVKSAQAPEAAATNLVPQGGLFWDGRVNTLQQQANGPLFNPLEMNAGTPAEVVGRLEQHYGEQFRLLFGRTVFASPRLALDEAMFAIARYQIESREFHPFSSKYDAWLAGRATLSPAEARGLRAFTDPARGNCAACHPERPTRDGLPPLFTDFQYEALGVPRNPAIAANGDPRYFDLGVCGPYRTDLRSETRYCGMFLTPSLRNSATRRVFFHNGVFHSLREVLDWYVNRDLQPQRFYPRDASGRTLKFDDLPAQYRVNVDTVDAPFNRHPGDAPALSAADIEDVIAFLGTLTDGDLAAAPAGPIHP
jgi:cytochrome c peroxidase